MILASVADVKTRLEISHTDHDDLIMSFLESASGLIEQFLNRKLVTAARTEYFDGGQLLALSAFPVAEATFTVAVSTDIPRNFAAPEALLADTEYVLDATRGILYAASGEFPEGPRTVQVTYTGGFDESEDDVPVVQVPVVIKWATVDQTVFMYRNRAAIGWSSQTGPDGGVQVSEPWGLLKGVKRAIMPYRRPVGYA